MGGLSDEPRLYENESGVGPAGAEQRMRVAIKSGIVNALPSGLTIGGKITEVTLNSTTWTALPATALVDRNGMGFQNDNGIKIKVGFDNTEPGFVGWSVNANGEFFIDVSDSIISYAKAESGAPTLTVMEVA